MDHGTRHGPNWYALYLSVTSPWVLIVSDLQEIAITYSIYLGRMGSSTI